MFGGVETRCKCDWNRLFQSNASETVHNWQDVIKTWMAYKQLIKGIAMSAGQIRRYVMNKYNSRDTAIHRIAVSLTSVLPSAVVRYPC